MENEATAPPPARGARPRPGQPRPRRPPLTTRAARTGPLVEPEPMAFLENVTALFTTNPRSPAWVDRLKACLGDRFRSCLPVW